MPDMQHIEIERYHDEINHDVQNLIEKYRKVMAWNIPENNAQKADPLIFEAVQQALDKVKLDSRSLSDLG